MSDTTHERAGRSPSPLNRERAGVRGGAVLRGDNKHRARPASRRLGPAGTMALLGLLAQAVACAWAADAPTIESPASALMRLGAAALVRDAWATQARLVKATRTSTGDVPPDFWVGTLKELNPRRVYLHRVNLAAVLRAEGQTEEGLYICLPISSYIPMHGTDGFEYTRLARDVMAYRRSLSDSGRTAVRRFGLFLPREDVYSDTPDVDNRIADYLRRAAADIPLASHPIVSDADLVAYDWPTHTLTLAQPFWFKIRRPSLRGSPFVVVADGEPLYVGAFFSDASSFSCPLPVIRFDERMTNRVVTIERGYPAAFAVRGKEDPRENARLKKVLQALGKLRE